LAPILEEVAKELKDVPNLVIANFDATANDVEGLEVKGFPTLAFYGKGSKNSAPFVYQGGREKADILKLLAEKSTHYQAYLAKHNEKEKEKRDEL